LKKTARPKRKTLLKPKDLDLTKVEASLRSELFRSIVEVYPKTVAGKAVRAYDGDCCTCITCLTCKTCNVHCVE
jgi:hypothetical protein